MVNVKVDGLMVIAGLGVLVLGYAYYKRGQIIAAINPANPDNIVNTAVLSALGEDTYAEVGDYVFGAIDLLNPFNDSDAYARQVYGLDN
jgi:hypothetical protein